MSHCSSAWLSSQFVFNPAISFPDRKVPRWFSWDGGFGSSFGPTASLFQQALSHKRCSLAGAIPSSALKRSDGFLKRFFDALLKAFVCCGRILWRWSTIALWQIGKFNYDIYEESSNKPLLIKNKNLNEVANQKNSFQMKTLFWYFCDCWARTRASSVISEHSNHYCIAS